MTVACAAGAAQGQAQRFPVVNRVVAGGSSASPLAATNRRGGGGLKHQGATLSGGGRSSARAFAAASIRHRRNRNDRGSALVVRADAFGNLSDRLTDVWAALKDEDDLSKENIKAPLKDIRRALLEADVSLPVVRRFIKSVEAKAVGVKVTKGVKASDQLTKVVADELCELMGGGGGGPVCLLSISFFFLFFQSLSHSPLDVRGALT